MFSPLDCKPWMCDVRGVSCIQDFHNDKDRREFISAGTAAGYAHIKMLVLNGTCSPLT
jgi:hypothetical protein